MHFLVESLPLLAGPLMLIVFRFIKAPILRGGAVFVIPMLLGIAANQLNGEGTAYLYADLLKAHASLGCFLILKRFDFRRTAR
jgi:hypothetical protein